MSQSHKRESLLTQLENMHKQVNDESKRKLKEDELSKARDSGKKSQPLFSSVLSRNERINSMPMFAGSTSHNGLLTSNTNQDMSFVMGLSENLLVECRRLQADNERKVRKLKTLKQNYEELSETHKKTETTHQIAARDLKTLRDTNWELEDKLQSLTMEFKSMKDKFNKNKRDLKHETETSRKIKADLEVATLKHVNLNAQLASTRKQYMAEIAELKTHVSDLNDENDTLSQMYHQLNDQNEQSKSPQNVTNTKGSDNPKYIALKKDLKRAQRTIRRLKRQILSSNADQPIVNRADNSNVIDQKVSGAGSSQSNKESEDDRSSSSEIMDRVSDVEEILDNEKLDDEISLTDVEQYAKSHNMVVLSKKAFERMCPTRSKPSASNEQVVQTVENTDINETAAQSAPQDLENQDLIKLVESSGHKVISDFDYSELQRKLKQLENPSESFLMSKVEGQGKIFVSQKEYQEALNPPLSDTTKRLETDGYHIILEKDYQELLHNLQYPTLDYLREKLKSQNFVPVSSEEYQNCVTRDPVLLAEKAKSLGYKLIEDQKYSSMVKDLSEPSLDQIKEYIKKTDAKQVLTWLANRSDTILMSKKDHNDLKSSLQSPSQEYLQEKASALGFELVQSSKYLEIVTKLNNPELDFLKEKSTNLGYNVVLSSKLDTLLETSEKPSLQFLKEKAGDMGYVTVLKDDFELLKKDVENPSLDFLRSKARGHKLVTDEEYNSLIQISTEPNLKFLTDNAKRKGFEMMSQMQHQELLRKALSPTKEELDKQAKAHGFIVINGPEYEQLRAISESPSQEFLAEKAKVLNLSLISKAKQKELEEKSTNKDFIFSAIKSLGFVPVPLAELNLLRGSSLGNASLADVQTKLKTFGYVSVSKTDYDLMNQSVLEKATRQDTIALCSRYALKPLSQDEYKKLKQDSELAVHSEDEHISALESRGYVILTQVKYDDLKNKLDSVGLDVLKDRCAKLGYVVVQIHEHEKIIQTIENPNIDFIKEKATGQGYVVVEESKFNDLESKLDSPSLDYIEEKANIAGRTLISFKDKKSLDDQIQHPSSSYISSKALEMNKCVVDNEGFNELKRKIAFPTREELESSAEKLKMTLLVKDEYLELIKDLESPSLDYLKRNIVKFDYVALSKAEYEATVKELREPSEAYLTEKATMLGRLLVDKAIYQAQQEQLLRPSESFLAEHAKALHKILISESEHKNLQAIAKSPTKEFLQEKATALGFVLVSAEEMDHMQLLANNPPTEHIKKVLEDSGHKLVDLSEYKLLEEEAESPSIERITELAKKHGYVLVYAETVANHAADVYEDFDSLVKEGSFVLLSKESYDSILRANLNKVTKKEVVDICSSFKMIPLPAEKYEELTQVPDMKRTQEYVAQHGSVMISREKYDLLTAEAECPSEDSIKRSAHQKGLMIVHKAEYDSLISRANTPTKTEVERQAEKLNLVVITNDKYNTLLKEVKNKSASATPSPSSKVLASKQYFEQVIRDQNEHSDKFFEPTKALGFVALSSEEYKRLKDNQKAHVLTKTDIYNGAKSFSLAVLPLEEYKTLLKKKSTNYAIDYANLEEYAARFDMKLVPLDVGYLDSPTPNRRKSIEGNSGQSLSFHDQSSVLTSISSSTQDTEYFDAEQGSIQRHATMPVTSPSQFADVLDNASDDKSDAVSHASTVRAQNSDDDNDSKELEAQARGISDPLIEASSGVESSKTPELIKDDLSDKDSEIESDSGSLGEAALKRSAEKLNLVVLPKTEYEDYLTLKNKKISREDIETRATELSLVVVDKKKYDELLSRKIVDGELIEKLAPKFGLRALSKDRLDQMADQLNENQLTANNIKAKASSLGYVALTSEDFSILNSKAQEKQPNMTKDKTEQEGSSHAPIVKGMDDDQSTEYKTLQTVQKNDTVANKEELFKMAQELGFVVLSEDEYQRLRSDSNCSENNSLRNEKEEKQRDTTVDDVVKLASKFGLVPIEKDQFEQIKEELSNPSFTKEEILEQALKHDLVAVDKNEYERLKESSTPQTSEENGKKDESTQNAVHSMQVEKNDEGKENGEIAELLATAERLGLFRAPREDSISSWPAGIPESPENVVVLPNSYFNDLLSKKRQLAVKTEEEKIHLKNERLESRVNSIQKKDQGFPKPPPIGGQKLDKQTSRGSLKSLNSGAKQNLVQTSAANAQSEFAKMPKSLSHSGFPNSKHSRTSSLVTRNDSMMNSSIGRSGSMGAISLATVASLSEPSIIPALTQTVIGEYLYKYYPYLGKFGLNSRHERFFWVHPYTLTLYWSSSNPVLANPSSHKTKCAAILAVDSVVDTNPYPAGLYHKTIVITSEHKTVKITCPTRQRHNIWYNSLRYLIQRSMEGISLEDIADDPRDTMYSGKIFPLPGENSKSASQRLSRSRRSVKTRMPKSSSMPIRQK